VKAAALRWSTVAAGILLWELVCRLAVPSDDYIAAPTHVFTTGVTYLFRSDTLQGLWVTTVRFFGAFAVTALLGVPIGLALGRSGRLMPPARDVFSVFYTLPLVPFYPLFVLWFGLGARSEVAFGAVHGIVPVILGVMAAAARVDDTLITAARSMGASRARALSMVVLPATVPDVVAALRIGAALSLLGVLLAELMVSVDGIGHIVASLIANLRGPELDAVILAVCIGAVVVNAVLHQAEKRVSRWRGEPRYE
jgi:NitT/TauT family transport system permease protein